VKGVLVTGASSTKYNLGNGKPTSVKEVIDSVDWRWRESHPQGYRKATA
jgi:UDP-glucose 4-epimerase